MTGYPALPEMTDRSLSAFHPSRAHVTSEQVWNATTTLPTRGAVAVARAVPWRGPLAALRSPIRTAYRLYVERCRRRRASTLLPHSTITRSAIVIGNLLDLAAETGSPIRLVSGKLAAGVFSDLIPNLLRALDAQCDLRIVVERDYEAMLDNSFCTAVRARAPDAVRFLGTPLATFMNERTHFILVGQTAYRVEVEDKTHKATACFNDTTEAVVPTLLAQFDTAWRMAAGPRADAHPRNGRTDNPIGAMVALASGTPNS